jgi:hypothetical protein
MRRFFSQAKFERLGFNALWPVTLVVCLTWLSRPSTPPSFLTLHQHFSRPLPLRDRVESLIPGASLPAWVWHLENAVFGKRKPVDIFSDIVTISNATTGSFVSSLPVGKPVYSETNGFQVWFLSSDDLKAVRQGLKQMAGVDFLNHPRISTADGVEACLFTGNSISLNGVSNEVGLKVDYFPRVRSHSTDLFTVITWSEALTNQAGVSSGRLTEEIVSIHTNLDIAARMQIPKSNGVFLVKGSADEASQRMFGVIIDPP